LVIFFPFGNAFVFCTASLGGDRWIKNTCSYGIRILQVLVFLSLVNKIGAMPNLGVLLNLFNQGKLFLIDAMMHLRQTLLRNGVI
jgi:hypothetical protein